MIYSNVELDRLYKNRDKYYKRVTELFENIDKNKHNSYFNIIKAERDYVKWVKDYKSVEDEIFKLKQNLGLETRSRYYRILSTTRKKGINDE